MVGEPAPSISGYMCGIDCSQHTQAVLRELRSAVRRETGLTHKHTAITTQHTTRQEQEEKRLTHTNTQQEQRNTRRDNNNTTTTQHPKPPKVCCDTWSREPAPMMIYLPPQGTPAPNTAADMAYSTHSTQPALRPHRAIPRAEDKPPQARRPQLNGLCSPLSEPSISGSMCGIDCSQHTLL